MLRRSRLAPIELREEERGQLLQWSLKCGAGRALALRACIVLSCLDGCSNREVAQRLGVTTQTVGKWRRRFVTARLGGLLDQPRSGAPRSISDAIVESVLAKTLHEQPPDAARWSSRRLAAALGISQRAVVRIWHTFDLRGTAQGAAGSAAQAAAVPGDRAREGSKHRGNVASHRAAPSD